MKARSWNIRNTSELDQSLRDTVNARVNALAIMPNSVFVISLKRIADFALAERLPSMFHLREFAAVGGLMSYGVDRNDLFRRAASYVDKILKGARPADLPIEQPTKFDLVVNLDSQEARSHRSSVVAGDGRRGDRVVSRVFMPKAGITSLFRYFEDTEFPCSLLI